MKKIIKIQQQNIIPWAGLFLLNFLANISLAKAGFFFIFFQEHSDWQEK